MEIIIAKHRKGATDIILLNFRGKYTRFENIDASILENSVNISGEILGSKINEEGQNLPFPPHDI